MNPSDRSSLNTYQNLSNSQKRFRSGGTERRSKCLVFNNLNLNMRPHRQIQYIQRSSQRKG
jgi:hypothetical protein